MSIITKTNCMLYILPIKERPSVSAVIPCVFLNMFQSEHPQQDVVALELDRRH